MHAPIFGKTLPPTRSERWALLDVILDRWFPRRPPGEASVPAVELDEAERRLRLRLPVSFREWYARYGARTDVWSLQDQWRAPRDWTVEDDALIFCVENQAVVRWGILLSDLAADDPPVCVSDAEKQKGWAIETDTTVFALQMGLSNLKWSDATEHHTNGDATTNILDAIEKAFRRLPFPDLHWPAFPTRFYGHDDLIVETVADTWVWITARTLAAFDEADRLLRAADPTWAPVQ